MLKGNIVMLWILPSTILVIIQTCTAFFYNETSLYAGLAIRLAEYFTSTCIYILTDHRSRDKLFFERLFKKLSEEYTIPTNLYTFREYHRYQFHDKKSLCNLPLQIVISLDEETHQAFVAHTNSVGMHGSDSYGGGVWLVFVESVQEFYLQQYFHNANTPFDGEIIAAELSRKARNIKLKEVYRVSPSYPLRAPDFGQWPESAIYKFPTVPLIYSRRKNLEGIPLKVVFVDSPPFVQLEENKTLGGYMGEIWRDVGLTINFTSVVTKKKYYGIEDGNGNWNGMIGSVQNGLFDTGVTDLVFTLKRIAAVDFSRPLLITDFQVFYQSTGSAIDADALFLPLHYNVYICLSSWIFVASLFLYVGCYLSDEYLNTAENFTYAKSFFSVSGALCAQAGGVVMPDRSTCRFFIIASFLITAVILPSYSASLMSFLAVSRPSVLFTNMDEFYNLGTMKMILKNRSYEYDMFEHECTTPKCSMIKIFKRDIMNLPREKFPSSNRAAIGAVCRDKNIAYFGLSNAVEWAINQERKADPSLNTCVINKMAYSSGKVNLGIIFPKGSHYRKIINHYLQRFRIKGILNRFQYKNWPITKQLTTIDEIYPVGITNVFMTFVILGFGMSIAAAILFLELYFGKKRLNKLKIALLKLSTLRTRRKLIRAAITFEGIRKRDIPTYRHPYIY